MSYPPFGSNSSSPGGGGSGVTSLQTLTGALMLTSSGATIAITTSGSNINLESTGSGPSGVSSLNGLIGALTLANAAGVSFTASGTTITPALGNIIPTTVVATGNISGATLSGTNVGSATAADSTSMPLILSGGSSPTAGNLVGLSLSKSGFEELFLGINKNSTTGEYGANSLYLSTYTATGLWGIGRGNGAGLIDKADIKNDSSGNVIVNRNLTVTGSLTGTLTGNASTATALQTARAINGVNFDGTAPITITAAAGTLTGTTLNSTVVTSSLTSVGSQSQALNMNSHLINNVTDPSAAQDAATKNYVDMAVAALAVKNDCQAATTTALAASTYNNGSSGVGATITLTTAAVLILDGYTPALGDRLLIKNQASAFQNGIYTLTTLGTLTIAAVLTRTADFNQPSDGINGALTFILNGATNGNTLWSCTTDATVVFGTTNINWFNFQGATYAADGTTLTLTGTTFSVNSTYASTLATLTGTQTLTNKRITKRTVTAADATSVTPNSDNADITYQSNSQTAGTLTINADTGTPTNGQSWLLKIKSTNVQTFSWNALYVGGTVPLPTATTGSGKIDNYAFLYDTVNSKFEFTGGALGF